MTFAELLVFQARTWLFNNCRLFSVWADICNQQLLFSFFNQISPGFTDVFIAKDIASGKYHSLRFDCLARLNGITLT